MPWKECAPMDEKLLFIADHLRSGVPLSELCRRYGISRKTGKQVAEATGDPRDFKTFDDFFEAVKTQIRYFVNVVVSGNQLLDYLSMNYRPVPALSPVRRATDWPHRHSPAHLPPPGFSPHGKTPDNKGSDRSG